MGFRLGPNDKPCFFTLSGLQFGFGDTLTSTWYVKSSQESIVYPQNGALQFFVVHAYLSRIISFNLMFLKAVVADCCTIPLAAAAAVNSCCTAVCAVLLLCCCIVLGGGVYVDRTSTYLP